MTDLTQAVAALQVHARQMRAVLDIADAITSAADIDRMTSEAKARLTGVDAEIADAQTRLTGIGDKIEKAKGELVAARQQTDEATSQARLRAEQIVRDARAAAVEEAASATAKATATLSDLNGKIDAARGVLDDLTARAARDKTAAEAELDKITAETAEVIAKAEAAKAYLAKLALK
jgi:chromosome segregation ATPase